MSAVMTRLSQTVFLDSELHEIFFEWRTEASGAVMDVLKVSRGIVELKGIALLNFWSMMKIDKTLGVTVIPNIQADAGYGRR
jgi:hypothetical protein